MPWYRLASLNSRQRSTKSAFAIIRNLRWLPTDAANGVQVFHLCYNKAARLATLVCEDRMSSVIDDYLVDPKVSLLDKTRMQAQVLVPVLRALRAELGKDKADAIVKQALRDWSKQLFAAIGDGIEGSQRHKFAAMKSAFDEVTAKEVEFEILRHDKEALDIDVTRCRFKFTPR